MKKLYTIKVTNKDENGIELILKSLGILDAKYYYGPFKTKIVFLCTDEQWEELETIIHKSNVKIKRV